jgi:TolB-like protein/predicted TPR repeat methyltransferase
VAEGGGEEQVTGHRPAAPAALGGDAGTADVFISYASTDKAAADSICDTLERGGITCWIAPRDVTPGVFYADAIVQAINSAHILIVVLSVNSVGSQHVLREVERASAKRRPLVAFRLDITPLPTGLEYFLSASHWLDASGGTIERALPGLADAVHQLLGVPAKPVADTSLRSDSTVNASGGVAAINLGTPKPPWNRLWTVAGAVAVVLMALLAGKFWLSKRIAAEQPTTAATNVVSDKSIAVLPFVDMSEKKDQEYFADGLSEELIDHLAHNVDLKVIARTSSFAFKGKNEDMRSIASKLGVANLLEGSVRKAGDALRITAQLIRASDGVHLWSEIYDRKLTDIFKVQDEISTTVAKELNAALNIIPAAGVHSASNGTANIEAYNLLLRGNYFFDRGDKDDNAKAVEFYRQALKLDPHYAIAWARLARVYAWQGYSGELAAAEAEAKGRDAAQRALAIDPNCADAYYARGNIFRLVAGDWTAATSDYEKAAALDPHGEMGDLAQGNILILKGAMSGRYDDVMDWDRRYLERNPLTTEPLIDLASFQQFAGRLEDSAINYRKLLELNPAYAQAHAQYAVTLLLMGKNTEALAAAEKESDDASKLAALACIHWAMGRRAESDSALNALERGFADRNEYLIAAAHAYRGEADTAFTWLDHAYQHAKGSLEDLRVDPLFRRLHGDPRFDAFLRKLKLTE